MLAMKEVLTKFKDWKHTLHVDTKTWQGHRKKEKLQDTLSHNNFESVSHCLHIFWRLDQEFPFYRTWKSEHCWDLEDVLLLYI